MKIKSSLLFLLLLSNLSLLYAQDNSPVHLSLNITPFSDNFYYNLCGSSGLCTFSAMKSSKQDTNQWSITQYDTNLKNQTKTSFLLSDSYSVAASFYTSDTLFILFQEQNKKKNSSNGILMQYYLPKNSMDTESVNNLPSDEISNFTIYNQHAFFTNKHNNNENLYYYTFGTKFAHPLVLKDAPPYQIEYYSIDTLNQRILLCLTVMPSNRSTVLCLCETDFEGNLLHAVDFPDSSNYIFQSARLCRSDTNHYLVLGSYESREAGSKNFLYGTFSMLYADGKLSAPNFHPFSKAVNNESTTGKASDVQLLIGNVFHDSTRYALVTETFRPEYQYNTVYSFGVPSLESVFVGYRSLNAYVNTYDKNGNQVWSYTVPLNHILSRDLTTYLKIAWFPESILLYYLQDNDMVTLLLDNNTEILDPIRSTPITENNTPLSNLRFRPWYDAYYLLSGFRIQRSSSKQIYFTLNKILYQ